MWLVNHILFICMLSLIHETDLNSFLQDSVFLFLSFSFRKMWLESTKFKLINGIYALLPNFISAASSWQWLQFFQISSKNRVWISGFLFQDFQFSLLLWFNLLCSPSFQHFSARYNRRFSFLICLIILDKFLLISSLIF